MAEFTLIIGNKNISSWSLRGYLALKHADVNFDEIMISLRPRLDREKMDRLTPAGKVPTLKHGDDYVWDSLAICEYMNDLYPEKSYWPKNIKARAHARAISSELHSGFVTLRSEMPMACHSIFECPELSGDLKKDIDRVVDLLKECREKYGDAGPYLFGEYSIADMMYAPVIFRFNSYQVELPEVLSKYCQTVINHPDVKDWLLDANPADSARPD